MALTSSELYVVGAYTNHYRYRSRPRLLLEEWLPGLLDARVPVTIVQHTLGEREPDLDPDRSPVLKHATLINLRGGHEYELWLKEALINHGFGRLPAEARYLCWQDTDVRHLRPTWVEETLHMLQHYAVGQTWMHTVDLGPTGNVVTNEWGNPVDRSFCAAWQAGDVRVGDGPYEPPNGAAFRVNGAKDHRAHTGYSWAIRRDALAGIGRLIDWLVIGSGDYNLGHAFVGTLRKVVETQRAKPGGWDYGDNYYKRLLSYADLCDRVIKQNVGCVPGLITHGWHGSKKRRRYLTRDKVIQESRFDPDVDIAYDLNGIPFRASDNRILRDGMRRYAMARDEDSVDED